MTSSLSLLSQLLVGGERWRGGAQRRQLTSVSLGPPGPGTSVMQVMASDADDPTYGSSARLVYSVLDGEHHFTVDPKTGEGRGQPKGAWPGRGWGRGIRGRDQRGGRTSALSLPTSSAEFGTGYRSISSDPGDPRVSERKGGQAGREDKAGGGEMEWGGTCKTGAKTKRRDATTIGLLKGRQRLELSGPPPWPEN